MLAGLAFVAMLPSLSGAQSLADVARAEEARRKQQAQPSKVYTNENLRRDYTASPPVAGDAATPGSQAADAPPANAASGDTAQSEAPAGAPEGGAQERGEKYWRDRMTAAREQLARLQTLAEALQSRVNALTADFVNRDNPQERAAIEQNRLTALAELERMQRDIAAQARAVTTIEDEARKANVPAGWLR